MPRINTRQDWQISLFFLSSAQYFPFSFKNVISLLIINSSGMLFQGYI